MSMVRAIVAVMALVLGVGMAKAEPVTLRIGWANMPSHMIPVLFSKPEILKHYGKSYTVAPVAFKGSSPQIAALAADQIDISTMSPGAMALAKNNANLDLVMFADVYQDNPDHKVLYLLVKKDGPIKSVADLKGRRVATNVQGSALDVTVRTMLFKAGLNPSRDVNLIEVRFPEAPAMLAEGKVDFAPVVPPFAKALLDSGQYRELADPIEVQGGLTQLVFLAAKRDFLEKNRAAVADFTEDYVRAIRWFTDKANRDEALKIIADYMQVPVDRIKTQFTNDDFYREPFAVPNVAGAQLAIDIAKQSGMLQDDFKIAPNYVDMSFVEEAKKRISK
ncbi:MAG TPA: ABC transporter substrate-binding protein [Ensifer sp.]|nr:ABC transporter substrate-binding protein [Ensifer sp.]